MVRAWLCSCEHMVGVYFFILCCFAGVVSPGEHNDWSGVMELYSQSLTYAPYSGNPHNQIAALLTYTGREFAAVRHEFLTCLVGSRCVAESRSAIRAYFPRSAYLFCQLHHYCRSVLCEKPLPVSRDNIQLLLEENFARYPLRSRDEAVRVRRWLDVTVRMPPLHCISV